MSISTIELERDIREAIRIINGLPSENEIYDEYGKVRRESNEDFHYYDKLDLEGKTVMTVASSGDHPVSAIFYKAKEVDVFDINRLTKYVTDLKRASILALDYEVFNRFFYAEDCNKFMPYACYYYKIKPLLSDQGRYFWDSLYYNFSYEGIALKSLFRGITKYAIEWLNKDSVYMNEASFNELKYLSLMQKEIPFYESCVTKLSNNLKGKKYDVIILSDIFSNCFEDNHPYRIDKLKKFKQAVVDLSSNLNPEGKIVYAYLRSYKGRIDYINANEPDKQNIKNIFADDEVETINVNSSPNTVVLVYKPLSNRLVA